MINDFGICWQLWNPNTLWEVVPRVDLCECYHCELIIDFAWVQLLFIYLHAIGDQGHFSFSCHIIEPILFKLISCANSLSLLWALKMICVIPWTLSIVKILTNLLWAWERKWLIVMSWFKFGGIIVDTREHEKNCKFFSSIQFNSKKKRKLMQASWELVSFVQ